MTEKLLNQSLFSQTQEVLESNFLPEILKEQVEVPLELQDGFIKEETGEKGLLELDLINCHPNMRNLISLVDFMGEKFPSAPGNAQMPGWMQSLFIEASRKELEPAIFCFLIKILLNRPMLFKPFRRFWYPLLVELIAEKRAPGKGFHYFLRDVSLILIDWHQEVLITDLWVSIGNKEKETVSKAVNNLMKVLADESKDIFRKNLELFEGLLEKWAHLAYLEKGAVISMLSINEEEKDKNKASLLDEKRDNKNKGPPLYLFKYLGASLIELGLCFKVPLLKDFPEFLSVGGIGGNLGPNAFKTYAEPIILSHLLKGLIHKKKLIALASISACGRLFKEIYIHETSEGFIKKTDALNKSMIEVLSGDKLRFVMLLKELVGLFPDFLRNREIFGKALEIITTAGKKDRSHIFKAFRLYIQTHNDRNLIEGDLREICLCIRASIPRILIDSEPECHNECLKLLELLATLLHLPIIRDFFENIFSSISLRYLKSQGFVEAFLELCFRLLDSVKGLMPLQEVVGVNGLEIGLAKLQGQIKRSLLTGLSLDSSSLRSRVFTYFEKDLSISQAPTQRLLSLISDLYDPELEGLWLTSSMPLLLSLAKESSDYERLLFDEPLSETLKFYDFDFRGGDYLLQANRTQPLTPIFTLTLSQAPIHRQEVSLSNNYQPGVRATNINYTQQESFKDISSASQLFLQRKNPLQMPLTLESAQGVLFQKPGSNIPFTQIGGFLKPESRHFKGQKMAAFLSENMVEFSQGGTLNNRLRFQGEKKQGIRINRVEGIRQKQAQLLETRQKEARKHEITALRKYRMGELPDIEIKARDIIDPMQGLCLNDPEIASDLFWLLFTGLFKEEASDDIRTRLLKGLEGFLRKSKAFNKMLMSSVHKIIYVLGKRRVFFMPEFDADLIRETGLKGESLYTSALLLEEQLIHSAEGEESLISAPKRNLEDKTFGFKEKAPLWLSLLELYRALKEEESIEGFMSQLLLREYNEHDLCSALDHKQRGNYKLALKYFEQKLSDSSIFEEEQDLNTKTKILSYLRTEQAYCYALLGKWEPLKEDTPPPLTNKTGLSDFWFYSRFSEGDFKSLIDKNSGFNENTEKEACFGYEMAVVSLFKQEEDIENARHWLGIEKSGFMKRFRSLGGYSEASRHELVDKLQRIYEIKEYMYLLKQETTESFEKALNSLILRWSSRKFSLENATDSILAWYKTFLVRDLCIQKIANGGVRVLNSNQEKRLGELLVENQVKLAHFLIKLGLLDSGDSYLLKVLAKRPKDYFSWDLIKTIAKLKIHQANRTVSKDFLHLAGNFHQIAKVLEKQREKFQVQLDELTDHKFRIYIRKCHEGLLNKIIYNPQAVLDEKNLELMLKTINEIFYKGFSFEEGSFKGGYAIDLKDRELKEGLKGKRLVLKETEALACFCEKVLILLEQNQKLEGVFQKANLKALLFNNLSLLFLHNVIQSLALGLQSDKLLLRTILLVEHYPLILGPEFQSSIAKGSIPLYLFLKWLPQMMHFLQDPSLYQSFEPVFMGLAQKYPQALLYPFHINNQRLFMPEEEIKETKDSFLFELKEVLLKGFPGFEDFVKGLNVLTHPEHRLSYHQTRIMACLKELEEEYTDKDSKNQEFLRKELILLFKDLYYDVLNDDKNTLLGKYNEKFARGYKKPFLDLVGGGNYMQISKLTSKASITDFKGKILKLFKTNSSPETIKKIGSGIEKIESFSRYLFLFTGEEDIEIPGQYSKGFGEPFPQYHVKISGFDQALLTLESLRRPKRVIMYGSDEKVYKFLVKGVEDLRLDQRLQQMFKVMNDGFIKDFGLRNKDLRLKTFEIIPMSKSLGLLEWLENTSPLKELLEKELKSLEGDSSDLKSQNKAFLMRMTWIASFNPKASAQENSKRLLYLDQKTIEDAFQEHEALIPKLLFRNALEKLSVSHEAFFLLKNKVIRNIASVSMACYVLGIGDRHLENFLINWRTGELIAIDFGYSFGAGIRLSLPELLPFRLTQCFEALTLPVGVNGLLRKSLILLLKSLKGRSDFLLQIAEAFIKDPLLDLTLINKEKVSKNNEISSAGTGEEVQTLEDYEGKKLEFMKKKLMGVASWKVMLEELELSRHVKEGYKGMIWEAVMGGRNKGRGVLELEEGLEVNEQVDCLLDQARDKNLLGRTWIGWTPYV